MVLKDSLTANENDKFIEDDDLNTAVNVKVSNNNIEKIKRAVDLSMSLSYFDIGTIDQRVEKIVYSSVIQDSSYEEIFNYSGSPGNYYLSSINTLLGA